MVSHRLKTVVQYSFILFVTVILIWFSLRGITTGEGENKWDYLYSTWNNANKGWLLAMAAIAIISHIVRAERWRMLLEPTGNTTKLSSSFLSVMVGYLVNLVIPRGGEVSRCYNLYKLDKTPVDVGFGTVVVERVIDVLCLVVLLGLSFLVESDKLFAFINTLPIQSSGITGKLNAVFLVLGILIVLALIGYWVVIRNQKLKAFIQKTIAGFKQGLLAVFKLERKALFLFYTILIWLLYFATSYCVMLAFEATSNLGVSAVLSLFAIGSIAMAAPLPGGTGSYHALVPAGLVFLYQIPKSQAVAFTFIFHGWQTIIIIIVGSISLIITSLYSNQSKQNTV
jgi:glycosyltransferase 2 family protein